MIVSSDDALELGLDARPSSAVRTLSRSTGFRITGDDLQLRGRCPDCSAIYEKENR